MGHQEEQTEDELREAVARPPLLLRQEHHPQDGGEALRLPLRLRPAEPSGLQTRGLLQPNWHCAAGRRRRRQLEREKMTTFWEKTTKNFGLNPPETRWRRRQTGGCAMCCDRKCSQDMNHSVTINHSVYIHTVFSMGLLQGLLF